MTEIGYSKNNSARPTAQLMYLILLGAVIISGCREPSRSAGANSNTGAAAQEQAFDFQKLVGQWQGIAYENDLGVFMPTKPMSFDPVNRSRPKEVEAKATMEFVIEVDEKYLQLKGVESCYITLIHKPANGPESSSRDIYRMKPNGDVIAFEGIGGKFELESFKVDTFLLKGQFRDVAGELMRRSFQVRLYRIDNEFRP